MAVYAALVLYGNTILEATLVVSAKTFAFVILLKNPRYRSLIFDPALILYTKLSVCYAPTLKIWKGICYEIGNSILDLIILLRSSLYKGIIFAQKIPMF